MVRQIGELVGTRCLGRGGFGFVYATELPGTSTPVCVKIANAIGGGPGGITRAVGPLQHGQRGSGWVPREDAVAGGLYVHTGSFRFGDVAQADVEEVFAREIALLRAHPSPILPRVYASGVAQANGVALPYYVMDRFDGPNLRDALLGIEPGWDHRTIVAELARLVEALAALATTAPGFFHGDLKPENLILTRAGFRLVDPALRDGRGGGFIDRTLTLTYNPLAYTGEHADTAAIALILDEIEHGAPRFFDRSSPMGSALAAPPEERGRMRARALGLPAERSVLLDLVVEPFGYEEMVPFLRAYEA